MKRIDEKKRDRRDKKGQKGKEWDKKDRLYLRGVKLVSITCNIVSYRYLPRRAIALLCTLFGRCAEIYHWFPINSISDLQVRAIKV